MASALSILFLGCWLAGQSGARGEPRVSISASPGEVIAPGGALTIRCCCRFGGRLFLYKDGAEFRELYPAGDGGEFTIRSARREDAGSYSCESRAGWWLFQWAYDSDTLHISVAETYYPKPSISLLPSRRVALGGAVNIWCWGGPQNMRFLLSKEGTLHALQEVEPARDVAGFPIRNVSRQDAGSYRCYYRTPWDPAVRSRPSDPVELVVAEGTDPAGPQQSDPPTTAPQGEGRKGKGPSLLHSSLWLGGRRTGTPWLCLLELQQELLTWPQGATRGVGEPRGPAPPSTARRGAQPAGKTEGLSIPRDTAYRGINANTGTRSSSQCHGSRGSLHPEPPSIHPRAMAPRCLAISTVCPTQHKLLRYPSQAGEVRESAGSFPAPCSRRPRLPRVCCSNPFTHSPVSGTCTETDGRFLPLFLGQTLLRPVSARSGKCLWGRQGERRRHVETRTLPGGAPGCLI